MYIYPHQSLRHACFHIPFSVLARGISAVENSAFFIWVWKQCANIACLYPLGGIMAAIAHWCSTKNWHFALLVLTNSAHLPLLRLPFCLSLPFSSLNPSLPLTVSLFLPFISPQPSPSCHSVYIHSSVFRGGLAQRAMGRDPWRMPPQKWKLHLILKALPLIILLMHKLFSLALKRGTH